MAHETDELQDLLGGEAIDLEYKAGVADEDDVVKVMCAFALLAVSTAETSIRPEVEATLDRLGFGGLVVEDLHEPVADLSEQNGPETAERLAAAAFRMVVRPGVNEVHLFLRCPLSIAGVLVATLAHGRRVIVYQRGSSGYYFPVTVIDRSFFGRVEARSRA